MHLYAFLPFLGTLEKGKKQDLCRPVLLRGNKDQTLEQKQYFSKKNVETLLTHHLFSEKTVF